MKKTYYRGELTLGALQSTNRAKTLQIMKVHDNVPQHSQLLAHSQSPFSDDLSWVKEQYEEAGYDMVPCANRYEAAMRAENVYAYNKLFYYLETEEEELRHNMGDRGREEEEAMRMYGKGEPETPNWLGV